MGPGVRVILALLTASDATAVARLSAREIGSALDREVAGSARKARLLDEQAPPEVARVATDGRTVAEIASDVLELTGWWEPGGER